MPITLTNALILNLDPVNISSGRIRVEGDLIRAVGEAAAPSGEDETLDCGGAVVLPGLVNGHTHLYSALAAGMPPPPRDPRDFHEILQLIWWRLDRALDETSVEMSGRIGALDALRCGTTTLIDHHASPECIADSLDRIERGIADIGLRGVLCYETTDRNGRSGAEDGLAENRRYLEKCRQRESHQFAALVGGHAAFTLSDETLAACVELAGAFDTGVHIHVAEDPCDDALCRERYGAPLTARLEACGLIEAEDCDHAEDGGGVARSSILGHGTHLDAVDAKRISRQVAAIAHNPRSNMNNRVGYAPVADMRNVQLGTDGIGGDMFDEARHAWFKARDALHGRHDEAGANAASVTPARIVEMLAQSARVAGKALHCTLGRLIPGAAADIVVTDFVPATPLTADNAPAHLIFSMGAQHVRHVMVAGRWVLRDGKPIRNDADEIRREAVAVAKALWKRMEKLDA